MLVVFDPKIGPYQILPIWVKVDPRVMVMKGYSTFSKASGLEPHCNFVSYSGHRYYLTIYGNLSSTSTLGQSAIESNGNEGVLHIP